MYLPRSLQSLVSTIQTVVLTADVFQLLIKILREQRYFTGERLKGTHDEKCAATNTPEYLAPGTMV